MKKSVVPGCYLLKLDSVHKERYCTKLALIDGIDPYELKSTDWCFSTDAPDLLPAVSYPDIVNYLVFTTSAYTADELRSYKGLDAYKLFVSGWVLEVKIFKTVGKCLIMGHVCTPVILY